MDLLAVQGTLKSLLQHHSSKASIRQCSAFFIVQFSHPYMTTGKTIALTRWTFFFLLNSSCMSKVDSSTRFSEEEKKLVMVQQNHYHPIKDPWSVFIMEHLQMMGEYIMLGKNGRDWKSRVKSSIIF